MVSFQWVYCGRTLRVPHLLISLAIKMRRLALRIQRCWSNVEILLFSTQLASMLLKSRSWIVITNNVRPPLHASIVMQRLRTLHNGRATHLVSLKPKNTKSPCTKAQRRCVHALYSSLILPIIMKGQDSRPSNGNHKNTQLETTKIPGKYHQSQNNQRSWSRRQYVPNYVSGANSTPLGSTPRMSPVDSSAADSLVNAAKTEREVGKKRDSEVLVEVRVTVMCIKLLRLLIRVCAGGHVKRGATKI